LIPYLNEVLSPLREISKRFCYNPQFAAFELSMNCRTASSSPSPPLGKRVWGEGEPFTVREQVQKEQETTLSKRPKIIFNLEEIVAGF
jgi:hypothetical protein